MKKLFLILAVVAMSLGTAVAQNEPAASAEAKPATEQKVEQEVEKYPLLTAEDKAKAEELNKEIKAAGEEQEKLDAAKAKVAEYTATLVEKDGNFITAKGPGAALDFAFAIVEKYCGIQVVNELKKGMMIQA